MATKKINWILILQAWAMAWVVIGHSPVTSLQMSQPTYVETLYHIAYSFHMPLFILVSGYLFHLTRIEKNVGWVNMFVDKLKRLGIPFLVFTFIALAMKSMFSGDMERPTELGIKEYVLAIIYPSEGPLNEMWFVAVLFWLFALQPVWQYSLKNYKSELLCLSILIILHFLPLRFLNVFEFWKALTYGIYFYSGILIHKHIDIQSFRGGVLGCGFVGNRRHMVRALSI